jgi:glyoxylase-like metal-dependent hydrolase (beta-lactamase superfamily II)
MILKKLIPIALSFLSLACYGTDIDTITDNIIVINEGYDRVSAVKTSEGIVIIDTHKSTQDMSRVRKQIINYFNDSTFVYIINTHSCLEHINGNSLFPKTPKIAHANFAHKPKPDSTDNRIAFINNYIPDLKSKISQTKDSAAIVELNIKLNYYSAMRSDFFKSAIPPDITFTDTMKLKVGNLTFELTYVGEGAHGNNSIMVFIPEEKTLFTGSALAMPPIIYKPGSWFQKQDVDRWISVLDAYIETEDLENIVASHVRYYSKNDLREMRDYYKLVSTTIKQNIAKGKSKKETLENLSYNEIDKRFDVFHADNKEQERHENNIEILWDYYNK